MATDWQAYADHMLAVLEQSPVYENAFGKGHFAPTQYAPLNQIRGSWQKAGA